ncbi:polyprenyl synthetase family protein [Sinomicrobium sp.]
MLSVPEYQSKFLAYLESYSFKKEPEGLYAPVSYIMHLGGKRLRPVLTLMAADFFGGDYRDALNAALAVEIFHNFTLVHDDIMDGASMRRGQACVHEKWDVNTGILSGDVMLIMSYKLFENYTAELQIALLKAFNQMAAEVCEGQQYDVDFEMRAEVSLEEYLLMITYKTAVLVGTALKMGALIAGASADEAETLYDYGLNLGIAFQLQDDYLDAFGDEKTFGKKIGGDIAENKKTFLYIKALERLDSEDAQLLRDLYELNPADSDEKIRTVKDLFRSSGIPEIVRDEIRSYTQKAFDCISPLKVEDSNKQMLLDFGSTLMTRTV